MSEFCLKTAMERDGGRCRTTHDYLGEVIWHDANWAVVIVQCPNPKPFVYPVSGRLIGNDGVIAGDLVNLPQSHEIEVELMKCQEGDYSATLRMNPGTADEYVMFLPETPNAARRREWKKWGIGKVTITEGEGLE